MIRRLAAPLCLLVPFALAAAAPARLPMKRYTSADGLAQDDVRGIRFDRDGFMWVVTEGGLSRFDGTQFAGFGATEGLLGRAASDIAFGNDGTYWVATDAGVFAFRPGESAPPGRLFRPVPIPLAHEGDRPYRLQADRAGGLWVGTVRGSVWRVDRRGEGDVVSPVALDPPLSSRVQALAQDPEGALWIGSHTGGVYRIGADGRVDHCEDRVPGASFVRSFHFPGDGSVWTAFFGGVAIFPRPPFGAERAPARVFGSAEGMEIDTGWLMPSGRDTVLVGTTTGIVELERRRSGGFALGSRIDRSSGLPQAGVTGLAHDPAGNLWAGLGARGLVKILSSGFATYEDDRSAGSAILDLAVGPDGRVNALAALGAQALVVSRPEDPAAIQVSLPPDLTYVGWGSEQKLLVDRQGSWWIASGAGLLRYDDPQRLGPRRLARPPDAVYRQGDGLPGNDIYVVSEDTQGDVWICAWSRDEKVSALARWSRASGRLQGFSAREVGTHTMAGAFLPLRDGSLWIHFLDGKLVRFREGAFQTIAERGMLDPDLRNLFQDGRGRVWLLGGTLQVCEDPAAARPQFTAVPLEAGDGTLEFRCAVEDGANGLWLGTNRGVVRLDVVGKRLRRFTVEDGLVGNAIALCERDGTGALWFSDHGGLSRLDRPLAAGAPPPAARLREIRIAGELVPLPSAGTTEAGVLRVPSDRRNLTVDYFAVHYGPGPPVRFQYRLDRSGHEWSLPTSTRRVQYAELHPGRYRFLVRTVDEDGVASDAPAGVALHVLAPLWQRAWFLALCLGAAAGVVYSVHRVRIARAVAVERLRTRIATDLHDDVGSSLSQIAILSQLSGRRPELQERITALAGEVIDSMGDVVWAISPRSDTVAALVTRMRRFASELFADDATALALELPEDDEKIDPEARRQLYLVFKEALHNVRRHAGARSVRVTLSREGGEWRLDVEEDGRGFDPERAREGQGLSSMRQRAERAGGRLEVASSPQGTRLRLAIPETTARKLFNG